MSNEIEIMCPLLNKKIVEGYCYDIWSIVNGLIKISSLEKSDQKKIINKELAKNICNNCGQNK
jgi:hypothetical protein